MKTKQGIPMTGAKRENQNQPRGDKENKPLVLPKVDTTAGNSGHEGHTMPKKGKSY